MILEDRIKYIYQNYSLCDDGCTYNEINTENMTVSCDCKVKTNLTTNESSFSVEKLDNIDIDSNFALIKCYNLVFSFKGKLKISKTNVNNSFQFSSFSHKQLK